MPTITRTKARTVLGHIDPAELGIVLPHEHVIHQISIHSGKADNYCVDVELVVRELKRFRDAGGGTICDVTPMNVGRDAVALREASRRSGVHIVSAVGLYQLEVWSQHMLNMSRSELADLLVHEAEGGATGVQAGFIGEIASHNEPQHSDWRKYKLWDKEKEIFRAVADAQKRTGLFVSTHASHGRHGVDQLRTLAEAGADTRRVVVGHCDAQVHDDPEFDFDYYEQLIAFDAMLEFDLFGWGDEFYDDQIRVERLAALIEQGQIDRLLISTDTCRISQFQHNGGRGYNYVFSYIIPALRKAGISDADVQRITVANPAQMLSLNQS